jgi:hypothetical protein
MASREEQEYSSQAPAPYIGQFLQQDIFPFAQQFLRQQFQNLGEADSSAFRSAVDGDATDISSFANNDICGLAYDADNGQLFVFKNGSAENSGNALNSSALDTSKTYAFYLNQDGGGTNHGELFCNFGNPSFSISSGNSDGKYGNFEYAPPSGFYALCTKRLAEFG